MQPVSLSHHSASPIASPTHSAPAAPSDWFFPPKNPGVYVAYRSAVLQARTAAEQAVAALTQTRRQDPSNTFWSHRALDFIGVTTGLLQATDALKAAGSFPYGTGGIHDLLNAARLLVVTDQQSIRQGHAPDMAAYARARSKLVETVEVMTTWAAQLPEYAPPVP